MHETTPTDDFAVYPTTDLAKEKRRKSPTSDLARQVARREKIANNQRKRLFNVIVSIVCWSIVAVGVFVILLGSETLTLETPVAVAFISAMAVQSFVLIGLLARGLFMHIKHPPEASSVE